MKVNKLKALLVSGLLVASLSHVIPVIADDSDNNSGQATNGQSDSNMGSTDNSSSDNNSSDNSGGEPDTATGDDDY